MDKFNIGDSVMVSVEGGTSYEATVSTEAWEDNNLGIVYKVRDISRVGFIVKESSLTKKSA